MKRIQDVTTEDLVRYIETGLEEYPSSRGIYECLNNINWSGEWETNYYNVGLLGHLEDLVATYEENLLEPALYIAELKDLLDKCLVT